MENSETEQEFTDLFLSNPFAHYDDPVRARFICAQYFEEQIIPYGALLDSIFEQKTVDGLTAELLHQDIKHNFKGMYIKSNSIKDWPRDEYHSVIQEGLEHNRLRALEDGLG